MGFDFALRFAYVFEFGRVVMNLYIRKLLVFW